MAPQHPGPGGGAGWVPEQGRGGSPGHQERWWDDPSVHLFPAYLNSLSERNI